MGHSAERDAGVAHLPIDVYEMPDGGQEALLDQIDSGTAVLAFTVCSACAPQHVLHRIEDGELDLVDGDALGAQWPCTHVTPPTEPDADREATR